MERQIRRAPLISCGRSVTWISAQSRDRIQMGISVASSRLTFTSPFRLAKAQTAPPPALRSTEDLQDRTMTRMKRIEDLLIRAIPAQGIMGGAGAITRISNAGFRPVVYRPIINLNPPTLSLLPAVLRCSPRPRNLWVILAEMPAPKVHCSPADSRFSDIYRPPSRGFFVGRFFQGWVAVCVVLIDSG